MRFPYIALAVLLAVIAIFVSLQHFSPDLVGYFTACTHSYEVLLVNATPLVLYLRRFLSAREVATTQASGAASDCILERISRLLQIPQSGFVVDVASLRENRQSPVRNKFVHVFLGDATVIELPGIL